ncbi:MAG TPA: diguanylate cyclase [Clostridiaceae bacterium]|nr:diguanylate cyclase [Clostridiaceae bacterium]
MVMNTSPIHIAIAVLTSALVLALIHIWLIRNKKLKFLTRRYDNSETLFKMVFEQAPIGFAVLKDFKFFSKINPMVEKILDRKKEDIIGLSWMDFTHPEDLEKEMEKYSRLKSGEIERYSMEKRFQKPDGTYVWVDIFIAPFHNMNNTNEDHEAHQGIYHLLIIQDINTRRKTEEALRESERSKTVFLAHLPGMAYRCKNDRNWTMEFVSQGCYELTGYKQESIINNKEIAFNDIIAPEYREILWNEWQRVLPIRKPFRYEYEIITASGQRKWVLEMGQGVYASPDGNGVFIASNENGVNIPSNNNEYKQEEAEVVAIEGIIIDITEQKIKEAQIQYMSEHDFITGIYNRMYYEKQMIKLDKKDCLPLSVIIADIDSIRLINGAFGYTLGDKIIRDVSAILKRCCRPGDILARIGGDEFSMLLPNTTSQETAGVIKAIEEACAQYNQSGETKKYKVSLSMGYATKEKIEESIEDVIKKAEEHLRNCKLLNRNSSHSNIISYIMSTVYEKSQETEEHAKRLAVLCREIGEKLNLSQKCLAELELLAMLHDIGKVGIDNEILKKPDVLTDDEWVIMRTHPEIGYRIAKSSFELEPIAEYILAHHERWDGKGYPIGLKGEEIPLLSRILAVADAFDAMTESRVYRSSLTKEQAVEEIKRNAGTQFDPVIAQIFIEK